MSELIIHNTKGAIAAQGFTQIFEREKNRLLGFVSKSICVIIFLLCWLLKIMGNPLNCMLAVWGYLFLLRPDQWVRSLRGLTVWALPTGQANRSRGLFFFV